MSAGLVPISAAALARHDDPVAMVLAWCEQGLAALTEAQTLEEATHVMAAISTLEHATKVQKLNGDACIAASALRVRAERRAGQIMAKERQEGRLAGEGRPLKTVGRGDSFRPATLADHGISRDQAAEYGRLADAPEERFEQAVEQQTERAKVKGGLNVTRSGVLRSINPEAEKRHEERCDDADRFLDACRKVTTTVGPFVGAARFGSWPWATTGEDAAALIRQHAMGVLDAAAAAIEQARTEVRRKS